MYPGSPSPYIEEINFLLSSVTITNMLLNQPESCTCLEGPFPAFVIKGLNIRLNGRDKINPKVMSANETVSAER